MVRHKSIREVARLYRDAEKGSNELLIRFSKAPLPFQQTIEAISDGSNLLVISGIEDSHKMETIAYAHVLKLCRKISPDTAVPILLQAMTDFYYGPYNQQPIWLGTAIKIALALIWKNVYSRSTASSRSVTLLGDAVVGASVLEQLQIMTLIYEAFGEEGTVKFVGDGLTIPENIARIGDQLMACFKPRGKLHRTLADSIQAIWQQPEAALESIENILKGKSPQSQGAFHGTIFNQIPQNESLDFWAGLWARLWLLMLSLMVRTQLIDNPNSIALFPTLAIIRREGPDQHLDRDLRQKAIQSLFWNERWYQKHLKEIPGDMIVERPVLRLSSDIDLYATAIPNIMDSLNWFVESSVMQYPRAVGIPLSGSVFEHLVSKPFEIDVCDTFKKLGFAAGSVTRSGTWLVEDKQIVLTHREGQKIPGQIDILAYYREKGLVIVVDCKVLHLPFTLTKMKNILSKVGEQDSEGYHTKLRKKIQWLRNTQVFSHIPESGCVGLIVLDRKLPTPTQGEHMTCDLETLEEALEEVIVHSPY